MKNVKCQARGFLRLQCHQDFLQFVTLIDGAVRIYGESIVFLVVLRYTRGGFDDCRPNWCACRPHAKVLEGIAMPLPLAVTCSEEILRPIKARARRPIPMPNPIARDLSPLTWYFLVSVDVSEPAGEILVAALVDEDGMVPVSYLQSRWSSPSLPGVIRVVCCLLAMERPVFDQTTCKNVIDAPLKESVTAVLGIPVAAGKGKQVHLIVVDYNDHG
ncbi:hypothetical protein FISHEDRAFT_58175 [Fistulina hepatica ATCC 64428]|nr:hypothetical protein FISHEDRAFT_58175 [Fistulina hepatica ATCC 64428]